jgi:hypothetical protein
MVIYSKHLKKLGLKGITLFPFILISKELKGDSVLLNHERIHLEQQKELLVIGFYVLYLLNFFINMIIYAIPGIAYRELLFEKESRAHGQDLNYISKRKRYAWLKLPKLKIVKDSGPTEN